MTADSMNRIETLANIGSSLLGVQMEAGELGPADVSENSWVFGYCFGLFEAMARYASLDQYTDGMRMMSMGFGRLVGAAQGLQRWPGSARATPSLRSTACL